MQFLFSTHLALYPGINDEQPNSFPNVMSEIIFSRRAKNLRYRLLLLLYKELEDIKILFFIRSDNRLVKMKVFFSILLVVCLSEAVSCQTPPPGLCGFNIDQIEEYVACTKKKFPVWVIRESDKCRDEIMPGSTDVDIILKICENEETGIMFLTCFRPIFEEMEEEANEIIKQCVLQVQG
ncbi:uncharacterized protein LOC111083303 [Limulus polyphemus]|uniref:Uncharacterized protein LOC111083303 n=1 Tax=Limulus polyphemus TaxID=6850 RepID=A0ABM1RVN8_LIMPO|nr:uncharacterized protein LOC111083303 [Limulus polyphemus]XP_022235444.1 uncharacterized protein LOC111083303 [Limulus polyphemus]